MDSHSDEVVVIDSDSDTVSSKDVASVDSSRAGDLKTAAAEGPWVPTKGFRTPTFKQLNTLVTKHGEDRNLLFSLNNKDCHEGKKAFELFGNDSKVLAQGCFHCKGMHRKCLFFAQFSHLNGACELKNVDLNHDGHSVG